jgi:hypothetical protein
MKNHSRARAAGRFRAAAVLALFATSACQAADGLFLVALPDINGNSAADFAALYQDPADQRFVALVSDGASGRTISATDFNKSLGPQLYLSARDAGGNGVDELVIVSRSNDGKRTLRSWDAFTVEPLLKEPVAGTWLSVAAESIDGLGGTVSPIALLETLDGRSRVRLIDVGAGGMTTGKIDYPQSAASPLLATLPDAQVAVAFVKADGAVKVKVKNARNGNALASLGFEDIEAPMFMAADRLPGKSLLTILGANASGGVRVQTRAIGSGKLIGNVGYGKVTPLGLLVLEDLNGNGHGEVAVLFESAGGEYLAEIKDSKTGASLSVVDYNAAFPPAGFERLDDIDGNGWPELGVIGRNAKGKVRVEFRDALTAAEVVKVVIDSDGGIPGPAPDPTPAAPTGLKGAYQRDNSIDLSWKDNANNETGYLVYECVANEGDSADDCAPFSEIASLPANAKAYTRADTGELSFRAYFVRATGAAGTEADSGKILVSTGLAAPTGLQATGTSDLQIALAWKDNSRREDAYEVQRCAPSAEVDCSLTKQWTTVASLKRNSTAFDDDDVACDTDYRYRTRATTDPDSDPVTRSAFSSRIDASTDTCRTGVEVVNAGSQLLTSIQVGSTQYVAECPTNAVAPGGSLEIELPPGDYGYRIISGYVAGGDCVGVYQDTGSVTLTDEFETLEFEDPTIVQLLTQFDRRGVWGGQYSGGTGGQLWSELHFLDDGTWRLYSCTLASRPCNRNEQQSAGVYEELQKVPETYTRSFTIGLGCYQANGTTGICEGVLRELDKNFVMNNGPLNARLINYRYLGNRAP